MFFLVKIFVSLLIVNFVRAGHWCEEGEIKYRDEFHCNRCVCIDDGWLCTYFTCINDGSPRYFEIQPYGNSSYAISYEKKDWDNSRRFCQEMFDEGDLASMETQDEWSHVLDEIKRTDNGSEHWLGGSAENGYASTWHWISGGVIISKIPVSYGDGWSAANGAGNWAAMQPNNNGAACLESEAPKWYSTSRIDRNWVDVDCDYRASFVCEFPTKEEEENDDDDDAEDDDDEADDEVEEGAEDVEDDDAIVELTEATDAATDDAIDSTTDATSELVTVAVTDAITDAVTNAETDKVTDAETDEVTDAENDAVTDAETDAEKRTK